MCTNPSQGHGVKSEVNGRSGTRANVMGALRLSATIVYSPNSTVTARQRLRKCATRGSRNTGDPAQSRNLRNSAQVGRRPANSR
eukprot:1553012-Prymnesium_polylepis.1